MSVGSAACGGTAHTHHQTERVAVVECRFIEHVRRGVLKSYSSRIF